MGTVLHTWPYGRFVQIQDEFTSKEMLGNVTEPTFLEAAFAMDCIWLPVHRLNEDQAKQTKSMAAKCHISPRHLAIERKQFRFSGIECHKPSVTHSTTLCRSNSSSPADSHLLKKPRLTKTGI